MRGQAQSNTDRIALGWKQLDWGLDRQIPDASFGSRDPFHSISFFVETLSRACVLDHTAARPRRIEGLRHAIWLMRPDMESEGNKRNTPFTQRRYILAAGLGQAGRVTGEKALAARALAWAMEDLRLQRQDGTNPERGGFDAGYQMVGVLFALRYLSVCGDPATGASLRAD